MYMVPVISYQVKTANIFSRTTYALSPFCKCLCQYLTDLRQISCNQYKPQKIVIIFSNLVELICTKFST